MGPLATRIHAKVSEAFQPEHLELINESQMHSRGEAESHFRLILVTAHFAEQSRVDRSRKVHEILAAELSGGVHALAMVLLTPAEWQQRQGQVETSSPPCASQPAKRS